MISISNNFFSITLMEKIKKLMSKKFQEHLSLQLDAPDKESKPARNRTPKSAGNRSFRRHNNLRFMITKRWRELGKG
jgi:hypothetical protein